MHYLVMLLLSTSVAFSQEDQFVKEARSLAADLKQSLMKNLSAKMAKEGAVAAVPFCHANVKVIAKGAAKDRLEKYEFGRTSHKVRNGANRPQPWAEVYLKAFQWKKKEEVKKDYLVHRLDDGKRVYLEPLYVEAKCLTCHGQNVAKDVSGKIKELYPQDQAVGFGLGEFRGFLWVKEK